jgi:LysR family transcriptional regulator, hydrogen peroxide-inducible genes activator
MEIHQLRYFTAVAENGSFSLAARRCHVTQPTLSQQILKLERDLGQRLFDRLGRHVALTESGRALLPRAKSILLELEQARHELAPGHAAEHGTLAIGAIPTMAPYAVPLAIQRLARSRPRARVTVREGLTETLLEALVAAEIDLAIVSLPIRDERVHVEKLGDEPLLLAVKRGHPLARRRSARMGDIEGQPAIALHEMHCLGQQVAALCRERQVSPRIVCHATQLATVLSLVGLGLGVSLVPRMCARSAAPAGCQFLNIRDAPPVRAIAAAWNPVRLRPRLSEEFVEHLRAALGTTRLTP